LAPSLKTVIALCNGKRERGGLVPHHQMSAVAVGGFQMQKRPGGPDLLAEQGVVTLIMSSDA
jgi:hypothetical protein